MASLRDYRTGEPFKIDPGRQKLLSAHEVLGATLIKTQTAGKQRDYLVRDDVEQVSRAFSQPRRVKS